MGDGVGAVGELRVAHAGESAGRDQPFRPDTASSLITVPCCGAAALRLLQRAQDAATSNVCGVVFRPLLPLGYGLAGVAGSDFAPRIGHDSCALARVK